MKYIRTKDGKIMLELDNYYPNTTHIYIEEEIIKKSDNIEELCDEFVEVKNDNTFGSHFAWNKRSLNEYFKYRKNESKIYGAIWTDKGLVYVAKMNEKEELELL